MVINLDDKKILSIKYLNDNGTVTYFNFKNGVFQDAETVDETKSKKDMPDFKFHDKTVKGLDWQTLDVLDKSRKLTDYAFKNNIFCHHLKDDERPYDEIQKEFKKIQEKSEKALNQALSETSGETNEKVADMCIKFDNENENCSNPYYTEKPNTNK